MAKIMPKKYYRIVSKGDAVRRARIVAGLTSADCAAAVGVSRPMLSSIENGAGTSVTTAHRIADVVGKTFEDLFDIVDIRPAPGRSSLSGS
jgi:DNA-binding XRE family transcriptional regulator